MSASDIPAAVVIILGFFAVLFGLIVVLGLILEDWANRWIARRERRLAQLEPPPATVYPLQFWRARRDRTRRPA